MRKIRDVLVCIYKNKFSERKTAQFIGISRPAVHEYRTRFIQSKLPWPLPSDMDDTLLECKLFPSDTASKVKPHSEIDFAYIDMEMKKKGATLSALYDEIAEQSENKISIGYSQFTRLYSEFKKQLRISLRQSYQFGKIAFVDYAGQTISIFDINSGQAKEAQIFVGLLGGSYYTFCEATWSQTLRDWVESHTRMFEYFGGVPSVVVHDNLRSAVSKADRLSPVINETYLNLCRHYETYPFAARAYKPKDKPRVEAAVLLVERWILFRLRKHKFFSLAEANRFIRDLLLKLNDKPFQKLQGSRFSQWITYEKLCLQPLPIERYEFSEWGKVRAGTDYHVTVDEHAYSVPHQYRNQEFEYRLTSTTIQLYIRRKIITSHLRSYERNKSTTKKEHRTPAHSAVADWSTEDSMEWARQIGPGTEKLFAIQLPKLNNHHFGYRFFHAIKNLEKNFGKSRLDEACLYAVENNVFDAARLRDILNKNLDQLFGQDLGKSEETSEEISRKSQHENIRGAEYYDQILNKNEGEL